MKIQKILINQLVFEKFKVQSNAVRSLECGKEFYKFIAIDVYISSHWRSNLFKNHQELIQTIRKRVLIDFF